MFTILLNHLLAKLTWGNYLWTLILLSSSIWLPWILAVAEGCPTHTGTRCCLWPQTAWWAAEEQGWGMRTRYLFIIQRGRDFGWAQQRRWGHSSQVVKAGPVEGACGVRRWCCCKQSLALKRPIKGSRCVLADDQPCCEGFWWQVICRDPCELAVEIEFCIE